MVTFLMRYRRELTAVGVDTLLSNVNFTAVALKGVPSWKKTFYLN